MWLVAGVVHGTSWELEKVRGNGVMAMLTLAIISVVAALQVFGKDRLIFWRESESGEGRCSRLPALALGTSARLCSLLLPGSTSIIQQLQALLALAYQKVASVKRFACAAVMCCNCNCIRLHLRCI